MQELTEEHKPTRRVPLRSSSNTLTKSLAARHKSAAYGPKSDQRAGWRVVLCPMYLLSHTGTGERITHCSSLQLSLEPAMKKLLLATVLALVFAASAIAQTSPPQSDQIIPPRDPPLGKADMGPDTPYEPNSAAGYEPNSATGIEGRSRGTESLSRGATEPREEFR